MPGWLKKSLLAFLALIALAIGVGYYFHENDSKFRYWWSLPLENRLLSVKLEVQRPFIHLFSSEVDPSTYGHLSRKQLLESVRLGSQWIINMQEPSGRFNYWQNPQTDTYSSKSEDNFLRQAGTNYALVSAFEITKDSLALESAYNSLAYLNKYLFTPHPDTAYYMFRSKAKLGGTALPMLAMLKLREINGDTTYDSRLKALANMILFLQEQYGTGEFKSTYIYNGSYTYEKDRGWESNIYPGEAMLALIEMYKAFNDNKYLVSFDRAYEYYSQNGHWKHFSFMPWATIAMSRAAIVTQEEKYASFAFQMTDRILYWQNINSSNQEYGSLFGVPTVFTSTWMEGTGEALRLASDRGLSQRESEYLDRLMISLDWLLQLQYTQADIEENKYPASAKGGFRRSLIEPEVRIDNTQHAISSILKAIPYIK